MGTALKILFSGNTMGPESTISADYKADFQLTRTEIVALFNGFSRWAKTKCLCFVDNGGVDRFYLVPVFSTLEQTHCTLVTCDSKGVTVG